MAYAFRTFPFKISKLETYFLDFSERTWYWSPGNMSNLISKILFWYWIRKMSNSWKKICPNVKRRCNYSTEIVKLKHLIFVTEKITMRKWRKAWNISNLRADWKVKLFLGRKICSRSQSIFLLLSKVFEGFIYTTRK